MNEWNSKKKKRCLRITSYLVDSSVLLAMQLANYEGATNDLINSTLRLILRDLVNFAYLLNKCEAPRPWVNPSPVF